MSTQNGFLRDNSISIILVLSAILCFIGLAYFDPQALASTGKSFIKLIETPFPEPWPYLVQEMPFLNVASYIAGAVAIFLIGREYVVADRYVYFAVSAYLLYFPLAGINWSTFTTISLFPSLFLLGFYFYKIELRWLSGILFILAATTVLFYSIPIIIAGIFALYGNKSRNITVGEDYFPVALVVVGLFIFFLEAIHGYIVGYYGQVNPLQYGLLLTVVQSVTFAKPLFFIGLMIPLITYGFFGPRLLPVSIPYFLLGIITVVAGTSPEPLVAILDLILPLSFIGTLHWVGRRVEVGIMPTETRILRFALFSLILMNILVIVTYFPFLNLLAKFLGI